MYQGHRIAARDTWQARETHRASRENAPDLKLHLVSVTTGAETRFKQGKYLVFGT